MNSRIIHSSHKSRAAQLFAQLMFEGEGQPRSTSDEFLSGAVFRNSRQFRYGGCSFDTIHANEQSRHLDKLDKHVLICLARKRNIFEEYLKPLTLNLVVDFQFIIERRKYKRHKRRVI